MSQISGMIIIGIASILFIVFGIVSIIDPRRMTYWGKYKILPLLYSPGRFLNNVLRIKTKPKIKVKSTSTKNELIAARIFGVCALCGGLLFAFLFVSLVVST